MSDVLIASLFGLFTLLSWGTGSWLLARGSRSKDHSSFEVNLSIQLPSLVIAIGFLIFLNLDMPTGQQMFLISLVNFIYACTFVLLIKALSLGPTGIVIPLQSVFPAYVLAFSIIFLGQSFGLGQIVAILLIIIGAAVVGYEHNQTNNLLKISTDKKLAILVGFLWGVGNSITNSMVDDVAWQSLYVFGNLFISFFALMLLLFSTNFSGKSVKNAALNKKGLLAGCIFTAGTFAYYIGASVVGSVVIILTIAAGESLIASLWSRILDKEILAIHKRIGVVIIVSGIIILNLL